MGPVHGGCAERGALGKVSAKQFELFAVQIVVGFGDARDDVFERLVGVHDGDFFVGHLRSVWTVRLGALRVGFSIGKNLTVL